MLCGVVGWPQLNASGGFCTSQPPTSASKLSSTKPVKAVVSSEHSLIVYSVDSATLAIEPSPRLRNVYEIGYAVVSGASDLKYSRQSPEAIIATDALVLPPSDVTVILAVFRIFWCSVSTWKLALKMPR